MNIGVNIKNKYENIFKYLLYFTIVVYLFEIYTIILNKGFITTPMDIFNPDREMLRAVNLIPFKDMWVSQMSFRNNMKSIVGNIALFIPLGMYIQMILGNMKKISMKKSISFVTLTSFSFELFQFVFSTGVTDINDIILNTFGGIIGILFYKILSKILKCEGANKLIIILGSIVAVYLVYFEIGVFIVNK